MLKGTETDNVIKNIVNEIIRECGLKGIKTNETLAASIIKLTVINPRNGFASDQNRPLLRNDVERLVALCVSRLAEVRSPSLACIKMQVYFEAHFADKQTLIDEHRENVKQKTAVLLREIVETTALVYSTEELEKLYRKLTVAVVLLSGLGNPGNPAVLREASTAFGSVYRVGDLAEFVTCTRQEKEDQIAELTQILMGIRLFNRDCHKGGEGIDDLPDVLPRVIANSEEMLQTTLEKLLRRINKWTGIVDAFPADADLVAMHGDGLDDDVELASEVQDKTLVVDTLAAARLMEVYERRLLKEVRTANEDLTVLTEQLRDRLQELHSTVRFRTAIPTEQVFPLFIELSEVWTGLQNVMIVLSVISSIACNLQAFSTSLDEVSPILNKMAVKTASLTDAERLEATSDDALPAIGLKCDVLFPAKTPQFDELPLEFLGFCAWAFVTKKGALVPANPNMGVCEHRGLYYAFSTVAAGAAWGAAPDKFVRRALMIARRKPELIGLLQLQTQIEALAKMHQEESSESAAVKVTRQEVGIQTELHPIESYIDPDYSWNEWELRRRALALANMRRCATVSTQTHLSNFRGGISVQAEPDKSKASQTMRDNSTNVPRLQNFIYGLRVYHGHDAASGVFKLTRPVHE